jgi:hypothetical protein
MSCKKQWSNKKIMNELKIRNIDHLGIVAGIVDQIGLVEIVNAEIGENSQEKISAGIVVKAMILNGLGFVSAPLYLFSKFFEGKAIEHLLGEENEASPLQAAGYQNQKRLSC